MGSKMNIDDHLGRVPVQAPASDSRYDKWVRWATVITDEIHGIVGSRQIWREVNQMVADHPALPPSLFFDFLFDAYKNSQAIAVRRQRDEGPDDISLWKLMTEIRDHPEICSRQRYVAKYDWGMQHLGEGDFDVLCGQGRDQMDPTQVEVDRARFGQVVDGVRHYVNRRVAHYDRRQLTARPTLDDLDAAIDELTTTFGSYRQLVLGLPYTPPTIVDDWTAVFRVPWLP